MENSDLHEINPNQALDEKEQEIENSLKPLQEKIKEEEETTKAQALEDEKVENPNAGKIKMVNSEWKVFKI